MPSSTRSTRRGWPACTCSATRWAPASPWRSPSEAGRGQGGDRAVRGQHPSGAALPGRHHGTGPDRHAGGEATDRLGVSFVDRRAALLAPLKARPWSTSPEEAIGVREGFAESRDYRRTVLWALMLDALAVCTVSTARSPWSRAWPTGSLAARRCATCRSSPVPLQPAPDGRPRAAVGPAGDDRPPGGRDRGAGGRPDSDPAHHRLAPLSGNSSKAAGPVVCTARSSGKPAAAAFRSAMTESFSGAR